MKLLTLLFALLPLLPVHDYHVSKTNVRYVAESNQVQVEMHLFVDDIEADMAAAGAPDNLEIGTKIQHPDGERYLTNYLEKHFRLKWNGEGLPLEIVGYELDDDLHGLWVYQVAAVTEAPVQIDMVNTIAVETFPDQKNIVKLFNGKDRAATLLMSKGRPESSWAE